MFESPPPLTPMSSEPMAEHRHGEDYRPDGPMSASRVDRRNHRPPQDLGAALDSLNDSQNSNTSGNSKTRMDHRASIEWASPQKDEGDDTSHLFLDEPMEAGLGIGQLQENKNEASSLQQNEESLAVHTHTKRPKRSSLIERSKAFQEKLNNFMADYSSKGEALVAGISGSNGMDEDTSNRFPTRQNDLRHVDQSVNLMDTESARYHYSDEDDDAACYSYDDDDDDVYANYTQGFTVPKGRRSSLTNLKGRRASKRGSLSVVVENGIDYLVKSTVAPRSAADGQENGAKVKDPVISLPSGPTKKFQIQPDGTAERLDYGRDMEKGPASCWSRYSPCVRWTLVVLLFLTTAVWLVFSMHYEAPAVSTAGAASSPVGGKPDSPATSVAVKPPPTAITSATFTIPPIEISTSNSDTDKTTEAAKMDHHKKVLEHVLEHSLFSEGHDKELDLSSSSAKKAVEWMSEYDKMSMTLLDAFHYENNIKTAENLRIREDVEDPTNHTNKIVDRYVMAVFYFKSHPDATAKTYHS